MFEIAVTGPFAGQRLGIVKQCIECRRAAGADAPPCTGFGPGCLVTPTPDASLRRVTLDIERFASIARAPALVS